MKKKFRWGIMGTAKISLALIAGIKASGNGEVAAIASRSADKAAAWSRKHRIPLHFDSYQKLIDCPDIDGIYNPLPNTLHAEWTIRALEAGRPVLCEKPLAVSAKEAQTMIDASRRTGVYAAEAFMYRYQPAWKKVRQLIDGGEIGRISTVCSRFTFFMDDRSEISANPDLGGGALMDVGCYCVNASRLIAGTEPVRVLAMEKRSDVDDTLMGTMEFPGGVMAQFETSIENFQRHRVEIAGDQGVIILENPWVPKKDVDIIMKRSGRQDRKIKVARVDTYRLEAEEFVEVCRGRKQPSFPFEDSVKNMAVIDALFKSAREGRAVRL